MRSLPRTTALSTKYNGNMGVDISGLNPVIVGQHPDYPDYDTATQEEKDAFFDAIRKYKEENPGVYFSSNWWAWRPIHMLCDIVSRKYKLRINTTGWGENSGFGLKNASKCEQLADALEKYVFEDISTELNQDDDIIYLCLGGWCTNDGSFHHVKQDEEKLDAQYPPGTILFQGVVTEDGTLVYPSHSSSLGHIKNWINFLRHCGGFEIY